MATRRFAALLVSTFALTAGPKKTVLTAKGENEDLILTATLHIDPQDIKQLVGSDLQGDFFVAEIGSAQNGKEIAVDPDDFVLWTNQDGEHTPPYEASQVAGKNVMVISPATGTQQGRGLDTGPTYGGLPVRHLCRVKSGNLTGALPRATDCSLSGPGALQAAAS